MGSASREHKVKKGKGSFRRRTKHQKKKLVGQPLSHPLCYTVRMMIKEDKRQATYELWFLGDVFNSRVKTRESFDALLEEAHECLQHAVEAKLVVGGVEIVEVSPDGKIVESVWSMNVDEFEKKN